ncbi:heme oxygenase 1 [Mitosporidium daphniae]|uniref:Heme oxygenase 1 n=1 Tax=Mitosporidium daphniae TaxID=1485682 RepID=A0A098VLQ1_9MICR|nr:heme oxygenase 1 [Mitosporidium daphniae]KGG50027.1 heme oxygenase 1 [Mitosporidium daphniae]|eukprot:XP_013236463.1 heme oxygenase 1 [Mitosporidium daphniae]
MCISLLFVPYILLAEELKIGTTEVHERVERLPVVNCILKADPNAFPQEIYLRLLVSFYHIYGALELALNENSEDQFLGKIYFPTELHRKEALLKDINFYCNRLHIPADEVLSIITPSTRTYIARIEKCKNTDPKLLIAIAYTRYLGDLSGGQIMSRKITKMYALDPQSGGVSFYQFPNLGMSIDSFKNRYREALNSLPHLSEDSVDSLIAEAVLSFNFSSELFEELYVTLLDFQKRNRNRKIFIYGVAVSVVSIGIFSYSIFRRCHK